MSDEFTLGDEADEFEIGETTEVSQGSTVNNTNSSKNGNTISIDEFYDLLVADYVNSRSNDFELYLKQGSVSAVKIYEVAAIEPFGTPTESDIERIKNWSAGWSSEAEAYQRSDLQKSEVLKECVGVFTALFTNERRNLAFKEALLSSTWNNLNAVIKEKCNDGLVELFEMAGIVTSAREMGLFSNGMKSETLAEINKTIIASGSKIESLEEVFKTSIEEEIKQDPRNRLDTDLRKDILAARYSELKTYENQINEIEEIPSKEQALKELPALLKKLGCPLVAKEDAFISECFNSFKQNHELSEPLPVADFYDLKSKATLYGFDEGEWKNFAKYNSVKCEEGQQELVEQKEKEIAEQNAKLQKLQEEQRLQIEASEKKNADLQARIKELEKKEKAALKKLEAANAANSVAVVATNYTNAAKDEIQKLKNQISNMRKEGYVDATGGSTKHKIIALLLLWFLGIFGAHKLYIGRVKAGILIPALFFSGSICFSFSEIIGGILYGAACLILVVDFFKILSGKIKDKNGNYVTKW